MDASCKSRRCGRSRSLGSSSEAANRKAYAAYLSSQPMLEGIGQAKSAIPGRGDTCFFTPDRPFPGRGCAGRCKARSWARSSGRGGRRTMRARESSSRAARFGASHVTTMALSGLWPASSVHPCQYGSCATASTVIERSQISMRGSERRYRAGGGHVCLDRRVRSQHGCLLLAGGIDLFSRDAHANGASRVRPAARDLLADGPTFLCAHPGGLSIRPRHQGNRGHRLSRRGDLQLRKLFRGKLLAKS